MAIRIAGVVPIDGKEGGSSSSFYYTTETVSIEGGEAGQMSGQDGGSLELAIGAAAASENSLTQYIIYVIAFIIVFIMVVVAVWHTARKRNAMRVRNKILQLRE